MKKTICLFVVFSIFLCLVVVDGRSLNRVKRDIKSAPCVGDTPPNAEYTCQQQKEWGKCNESWMDGFCCKTCGKVQQQCIADRPPPGSPGDCEQQKQWNKCGEPWMAGYCCTVCAGHVSNEKGDQGKGNQGKGDQGKGDQGKGDQGKGDQGKGDHGKGEQGKGDQGKGDQGKGHGKPEEPKVQGETPNIKVEAESGKLNGGATVSKSQAGYSGTGYVTNIQNGGDGVTVNFQANDGLYVLTIRYSAPGGPKNNHLYVNGQFSQSLKFPSSPGWQELSAGVIYLTEGANSLQIEKDWGFVDIDYFFLQSYRVHVPQINPNLNNPSPLPNAKRLYNYLRSVYRKKFISGQTLSAPSNGVVAELDYIQTNTGKQPALAGFEFQNYSPVGQQSDDGTVSRIIDWYLNKNGIPQVQWHWCSPSGAKEEWWRSFYTDKTNFDVSQAVKPGTAENQLIIRDLDVIASKLKLLQDQGVPILWRPLHEAEGGWFWWGAKGPEACKSLYKIMYDRFVNHHGLTNLIWVWVSGTSDDSDDWYPGDKFVDIIGADVYAPPGNNGPLTSTYYRLYELVDGKKIIALLENGPVPDPKEMVKETASWSWWMTWSGEFVLDGKKTTPELLRQYYNSPSVVTLNQLPNLKSFDS